MQEWLLLQKLGQVSDKQTDTHGIYWYAPTVAASHLLQPVSRNAGVSSGSFFCGYILRIGPTGWIRHRSGPGD